MINKFLRKTGVVLLSGSIIVLSMVRCTNSDEIGLNLTPPGERFRYVIDSSSVVTAKTLRQDSISSEKRSSCLLGSMVDPVFGRSTASLLTQLRLSSNDVDFGTNPQLDSAMLLIKYQDYYGDTTTLQGLRVYELKQDLYFDSTYYSTLRMEEFFDPQAPLADLDYYPAPTRDSLLIRLSDDFGTKLINADTSHLSNNTAWLSFFKGLYLQSKPVDAAGAITYFDFTGERSRLILYYHNDAADSLNYEVVITTDGTWVNLFNHDYTGSPVQPLINDSLDIHPEVYLQSMAGLRNHLKINLPQSLLDLVETGVTINKAELILPLADDPTQSQFARPKSLRVYNARTDGKNEFIDDLSLGEEHYGGSYNSKTNSYRFNISMHIQNILHPDPDQRITNTGLFLVITDERTSANRLILKNGGDFEGMKLVITYTPVN